MKPILLSSRLASQHKSLQQYVYPLAVLLIWAIIAGAFFWHKDGFFLLYYSAMAIFFAYSLHTRGKKLSKLSYDREYLYLVDGAQEEMIPLWQVKQVGLTTLNGGYRIDFSPGACQHAYLLFLPSFWYPLNYKKQDARIERFQDAVSYARHNRQSEKERCGLPS